MTHNLIQYLTRLRGPGLSARAYALPEVGRQGGFERDTEFPENGSGKKTMSVCEEASLEEQKTSSGFFDVV